MRVTVQPFSSVLWVSRGCSDDLTGFIPESVSVASRLDGSASAAWLVSGWIRHLPSPKWLARLVRKELRIPIEQEEA